MQDTIRRNSTDRRNLFRPLFITLLIAALAGLMPAYTAIKEAVGQYYLSSSKSEEEMTRKRILDWMDRNSNMSEQVLSAVYSAASVTGNRDLILAICLVESNFNPGAESKKGAIGLMGIMPDVWLKELKEEGIIREKNDLYRISANIAAGSHVLSTYLSETNDLRKALIRYVGGTSWYAVKVLEAEKQIRMAQQTEKISS